MTIAYDCPTCNEDHEVDACPVAFGVGDPVWLADPWLDGDDPADEMRVVRLPSGARPFAFRSVECWDNLVEVPESALHEGYVVAYVRCRICRETLIPAATAQPLCGRACSACEADAQGSYREARHDAMCEARDQEMMHR